MLSRLALRLLPACFAVLPVSALACSGKLHIALEDAGVYALDYAAIVAAQPGLGDCPADRLVLTERGHEVPIRIVAGTQGAFGPGSRIEWIGRRLHGPESWYDMYSNDNAYLLGAAPGTHARIVDAGSHGAGSAGLERTLHLEHENLMMRLDEQQQKPFEEPDVFQWAKLTQIDPQPFTTKFDLPDFAAAGKDVSLAIDFRGLSTAPVPPKFKGPAFADHHVDIEINGHRLDPLQWNGRDEIKRELTVPAAWLAATGNTLTLRVPKRTPPWAKESAVDVVMFNWMTWRYRIHGDLAVSTLPFESVAGAEIPLEVDARGKGTPVLFGSDGVRRPGREVAPGRFAFAPAPPGVELFPVFDATFAAPLAEHAVSATDWHRPEHGYDYIIVTHPSLRDAVLPLAKFHARQGHEVALIDVDDVYDEFNDGIKHPRAIRNLVDWAWHHWPAPRPRFLLLVGDASFDIRHQTYVDTNYAKFANSELLFPGQFGQVPGTPYKTQPKELADRNLIPTWQFPSPEGQSASDNAFVSVDGHDWHPALAVGRFPVVHPDEVKAIVDKTIAYLSKPQPGPWQRDVMFITDAMKMFQVASDQIAGSLAADGFVPDKVYADAKVADNPGQQNHIAQGIDDGRVLVHFYGHGGRYIWRTGPPDMKDNSDLFTLDDVAKLKNGDRLPMVLSMTCYSAPFDNPSEDSIGEKILREQGRGAIAVFAASWRNSPSTVFSESLIKHLLTPGMTIGDAIVAAKHGTNNRINVEMYNLLGDPAVVLQRPRDTAHVMADDDRWTRGVRVDLGRAGFHGDAIVEWFDETGNRLSRGEFRLDQSRFRLAAPAIAWRKPVSVAVYAASVASGHDIVGGLELKPPNRRPKPWTTLVANAWRALVHPYRPLVRTADTIALDGFDGDTPAIAAGSGHGKAPSPSASP